MQCVKINQTDTESFGDRLAGFPAHGYTEASGTCQAGNYKYVATGSGTLPSSFVIGLVLQKKCVQASPTFNITRRRFQIIRVPLYANLKLGGQLNAAVSDGLVGGVIAVDVAKKTNFAGQTNYAAALVLEGLVAKPASSMTTIRFAATTRPMCRMQVRLKALRARRLCCLPTARHLIVPTIRAR